MEERPAARPGAWPESKSDAGESDAGESTATAPPRDAIELMLLHGDCAFLLDLWAL